MNHFNEVLPLNKESITEEMKEKYIKMFKEIQEPFKRHCPIERKNFLPYKYVLYKFAEIIDGKKNESKDPLIYCIENGIHLDKIWKKICKDMNWEFYTCLPDNPITQLINFNASDTQGKEKYFKILVTFPSEEISDFMVDNWILTTIKIPICIERKLPGGYRLDYNFNTSRWACEIETSVEEDSELMDMFPHVVYNPY
jgi:hypothetical protein